MHGKGSISVGPFSLRIMKYRTEESNVLGRTQIFKYSRPARYVHNWWKMEYTDPSHLPDLVIVVFRSQVPPTTSRHALRDLDQESHAEAMKSGGLLKYWFGMPDADGRNLATCKLISSLPKMLNTQRMEGGLLMNRHGVGIWRKHSDARPASSGHGHKAAARATASMYTEWGIERLRLEIANGVDGWGITQWEH